MWVITIILIWNISNIYSWKSKICFLNLTCYWMCFALTRLALYACLCTQIRIINMGVWQFAFRIVSTPCDLRITGSCFKSKLLIQAFINLGFEVVGQTKPITFFIDENFVRRKAATNEKIMVEVKNRGNIKLVKKQ